MSSNWARNLRKSAEKIKSTDDDDTEYSDADDFDDEVFLDDDEYEYEDQEDCFNQMGNTAEKGKVTVFMDHYKKLRGIDSAEVRGGFFLFFFCFFLLFFRVPL